MRFDKSFKILKVRDEVISLDNALTIARENGVDGFAYDPLGMHNAKSWYYVISVLELLQQMDLIREVKILKSAPSDQIIVEETGAVY